MNFLLKSVGVIGLVILQSCGGDGQNPFISGGDNANAALRMGSGIGPDFIEGAIDLSSSPISTRGSSSLTVNFVDAEGILTTAVGSVSFTSTCVETSAATISPATDITIAGSSATATYTDISCNGNDTITATATLDGETLTASAILAVAEVSTLGTGSGTTFTPDVLNITTPNIITGGQSSVSVNIVDSSNTLLTDPLNVTFSSICSSQTPPLASFTPPTASNVLGTFTTTYIDNGCLRGADLITATLENGNGVTASSQIIIKPLQLGTGSADTFTKGLLALDSTEITESESTIVTVNIVDSTNALVKSLVSVTFSSICAETSPATASFSQTTVYTDLGTASTEYKDEGCPGDKITATLNTVSSIDPTASSPITIKQLRIGNEDTGTFTNGLVTLGLSSISAGGTTIISADVVDRNDTLITTPVTVSFESNCVKEGTASFDNASASTTNDGTASVTYTAASGCSGIDTIFAKIDPFTNKIRTASADLTVASPGTGSIQFSSTSSDVIALKGTGNSSTLQENATLTFKVVDTTGAALSGQSVTFTLNTTLGGVTLQSSTDTSDAGGLVQAIVQSGTVSTNVAVTASVDSTTFKTQSRAIVISTGLPDQDSFSLSAETLNPRAWDHDLITVNITALLSDRFNNPIQDGTNITFTTELGSIISSCSTVKGACTVVWTSAEPRGAYGPGTNSGRTTILAHVIGEETFTDADGNGVYSGDGTALGTNGILSGDGILADSPPAFNDIPEPFVDSDEDGVRDDGVSAAPKNGTPETFKDFNGGNVYDDADKTFNGVVCTHATECGADKATPQETTFVWKSLVLVMSEDTPRIIRVIRRDTLGDVTVCDNTDKNTATPPTLITSNDCYDSTGNSTVTYPSKQLNTEARVGAGNTITYFFTIVGGTNYQIMPAGTKIDFTVDNGEIASGAAHLVINTNSNTYSYDTSNNWAPNELDIATYSVTIQADTTPSDDGNLTISVDSNGLITDFSPIPVNDRIHFVSITAPTTDITISQGVSFTLAAIAFEPIDGDVTSDITGPPALEGVTWSSDQLSTDNLPADGNAASVDTTNWALGIHTLTATSIRNSSTVQATILITIQ